MTLNGINIRSFTKRQLQELQLVKNGDIGSNSKVYKLDDDECLKVFNKSKDIFNLFSVNDLTKVNFGWATLPRFCAVLSGRFCGYTMEYIDGIPIILFGELNFLQFLNMYSTLLQNVLYDSSQEGIKICDVHFGNILYDYYDARLKMVDTDSWKRNLHDNKSEIKKNNSIIMSRCFSINVFGMEEIYLGDDFVDYYESVKSKWEKRLGKKMRTISDVYEGINGYEYRYKRN